jgi:transposase
MSTRLLYHGFGLVGYTCVKTTYEGGTVIFTIKHKRNKLHCPACGSRDLVLRGCSPRRFRMVPIGSKVIYLDLDIQRVAGDAMPSVRSILVLPIPASLIPEPSSGTSLNSRSI